MDTDTIAVRLAELFSHARWIIVNGVSAGTPPLIEQLREWGGAEFLMVAGGAGVGDQPDVEVVTMPSPPGTVMEGFRRFAAKAENPPPDIRDAVDRFDPEGTARALGPLFAVPPEFLGRRLYGSRPPAWEALEDKMVADTIWDEAGIPRAGSAVVALDDAPDAADRLRTALGTVWAADNTEGWHGGGEYTRWVADDAAVARALTELRKKTNQVRVMPFLDGIPCSIHGVVTADGVAALRPVELLILRRKDRTGFIYAGVADTWDPPPAIRDEMRSAARAVGAVLRRRSGHRGPFAIDGVATDAGFRPTELNPRFSVGYAIQARTVEALHGSFFDRALVEGDLDVPAAWLENLIVPAAESARRVHMGVPVSGTLAPASMTLAISDGAVTEREEGGSFELGPSPAGSFLLWKLDPADVPAGASFAPYAASAIALATRKWDLPLPDRRRRARQARVSPPSARRAVWALLCQSVVAEDLPDLAGDVAFGGADDDASFLVVCGVALLEVVAGLTVVFELGDDDGVEGAVCLPVPSPVEPDVCLT